MTHLSLETLARLVDEAPSPEDRNHLSVCSLCAGQLRSLSEQTRRLAGLPELSPPENAWAALQDLLREEGLFVEEKAREGAAGRDRRHTPPGHIPPRLAPPWGSSPWMRAAAAVILFVGGVIVGAISAPTLDRGGQGGLGPASLGVLELDAGLGAWDEVTLDEAEQLVRRTQEWHLGALFLYRDRLESVTGASIGGDPLARLLVLENLVAVTEAGVREAPGDPFLNGLLVSAVAERQAAWEGISFASDGIR